MINKFKIAAEIAHIVAQIWGIKQDKDKDARDKESRIRELESKVRDLEAKTTKP